MNTELPEDVLAFVRRIADAHSGQVGIDATALLAKYDPPKWLPGDVVQGLMCISVRTADGSWLCSLENWIPTHGDDDMSARPGTLIARGGKAVSA